MDRRNTALLAGPLIAAGVWLLLRHLADLDAPAAATAAITTWTALWWVLEPIPIPATSLIPFALLPLAGVLDQGTVARAYGHPLILLLLGGFILSTAMERSGAHQRVALTMLRAVGGAGGRRLILGFMLASAGLSMWISNTATTLMLLPVALATLQQAEEGERRRLAVPLLLGIAYAANIGGIGTPVGTPPNVIFMAQYQAHTGSGWSFLQWMRVGVPMVIILVPLAWLWVTRGMGPGAKLSIPHPGPWTSAERRVLAVFALTALLWITRTEPFGGWNGVLESFWGVALPGRKTLVGDGTVALAMVVLMFVIPDGRDSRLLDWKTAASIPWGLLILFGGGMAIGMAFGASGLSKVVGDLLSEVTTWHVLAMMAVICLVVTFLTEVTSNTATTNVLMPILAAACGIAGESGAIEPALLMVPAAISASCAFMLPVATAPNAIVFGTGHIKTQKMMREGLLLNVVGAAVVSIGCYLLLT